MKKLFLILLASFSLTACTNNLSIDDYTYTGPSTDIFHDNNREQCRIGGVRTEWLIDQFRLINGDVYGMYVVPEKEVYPYYSIFEKARYGYKTLLSETGWVRLSDLDKGSIRSRVREVRMYYRHQKKV